MISGKASASTGTEVARALSLSINYEEVRTVRNIIKLVQAIADLIRALAELVRAFKS